MLGINIENSGMRRLKPAGTTTVGHWGTWAIRHLGPYKQFGLTLVGCFVVRKLCLRPKAEPLDSKFHCFIQRATKCCSIREILKVRRLEPAGTEMLPPLCHSERIA